MSEICIVVVEEENEIPAQLRLAKKTTQKAFLKPMDLSFTCLNSETACHHMFLYTVDIAKYAIGYGAKSVKGWVLAWSRSP